MYKYTIFLYLCNNNQTFFMRETILAFFLFSATILGSCTGGGTQNMVAVQTQPRSVVAQPTKYGYVVEKIFPHSQTSYTQGLVWSNGALYEGTGMHGQSALMRVELKSGSAVQTHKLGDQYFGEGIALFGGKIYQITWQEQRGFVYDAHTFRLLREFEYHGEGWGLTADSTNLYMSNGSDKIYVRDPQTFNILSTIDVKMDGKPVEYLNELEWIEGEIWANVYTTDIIVRIDPKTGVVTGVVNLTNLLPKEQRTPQTDVLNGIAYDAQAKRIFVTGKNWSKLYEIQLVEN